MERLFGEMPDASAHWREANAQFRAIASALLARNDDLLTEPDDAGRRRAIEVAAQIERYAPAVHAAYLTSITAEREAGEPGEALTRQSLMFDYIRHSISAAAPLLASFALAGEDPGALDERVLGFLHRAAGEYDQDSAWALASACRDLIGTYTPRKLRKGTALLQDLEYLRWLNTRAVLRLEDRATGYLRAALGVDYPRISEPDQ